MGLLSILWNTKTPDKLADGEVELYAAVHDDGRVSFVDMAAETVGRFASEQGLLVQRYAGRPIGTPLKASLTLTE